MAITDNTTLLNSLLEKANALPDTEARTFKAICFTVNGTAYPAEEGMTWAEWCESDYNTANAVIVDGGVFISGNQILYYYNDSGEQVDSVETDVIIANMKYYMDTPIV